MSSKQKCEACGEPTDFRGWYFVCSSKKPFSLRNSKKEYHWWCGDHFRIRMFNLLPFVCTKACHTKQMKRIGVRLPDKDWYVWLDLSSVLVPATKFKPGESVPMKPLSPKCPWCGKGMKLVGSLMQNAFISKKAALR